MVSGFTRRSLRSLNNLAGLLESQGDKLKPLPPDPFRHQDSVIPCFPQRLALRGGARRRRSEMSIVIFIIIVIGVVVVIVGATVRVHVTMSVGRHHCTATIMMIIISVDPDAA